MERKDTIIIPNTPLLGRRIGMIINMIEAFNS